MTAGRAVHHVEHVSVIVPSVSQAAHLAQCLAALQQAGAPAGTVLDVIVVLNGASSDVRDVARTARGIRVVESAVNRGFAGGCQLGVRVTDASRLVFLNDDVRVLPGWLDPLLESMAAMPRLGAVAPRVLDVAGAVQEIGSIIWRDGTTRPIGRGLASPSLAWRWRRRVDYASACALLVRREAWDRVGGFDEGYHPAYYEDVDFCLALEAAGYEVWVDPRGDVVHAGSASSSSAFKTFLFGRHHARLVSRWASTLDARVAAPTSASKVPAAERAAVDRLAPPGVRVLVIDDRVPRHGIGSGFDRMADTLLDLAAGGARVRCLAAVQAPEFVPSLAAAGVAVVEGAIDEVLEDELLAADVVLVSRPNNAARVETTLARLPAAARPAYVYDAEALYHRRLDRLAALLQGEEARVAGERAEEWRALETRVATSADAVVCVSRSEAEFFARAGASAVHVVTPWVRRASLTPPSLAGRTDVGFVAGWLAGVESPNGDALQWFAAEVLPLIVAEVPWARLRVTGTLPPALRRLQGVHLTTEGFVPDLAAFYAGLRVAIAPLRFGAGVKVKTLEAVQHGVPVVATGIGAEGLESLHGGAIAVHDAPGDFAAAVIDRLTDPAAWRAHRDAIESAIPETSYAGDWTTLVTGAVKGAHGVGRAI